MTKPSRADQRRRTEARILDAARGLFAELGYDRTTIRAVATAAGVDAGLVMHYFGSKEALFARATDGHVAAEENSADDGLVQGLIESLGQRLAGEPEGSLALLRSMLTNPAAAERARTAAVPQLAQMAAGIASADAELRAALLGAIVHGVIIERYLLRFGTLAEADPAEILDLLRPCFESLATPS